MRRWLSLLGISSIYLLVACAEPTAAPTATTAASAETAATETVTIPPTATAVSTATAMPEETAEEDAATAIPSATPEPTATTMLATPLPADYELTIDMPSPNSTVVVGQEATFSGILDPAPVDSVDIRLQIGERVVLSGFATVDADTGMWTLTTAVSPNIVGPATLTVAQSELNVEQSQPVLLAPDTRQAEPFVILDQPDADSVAAAGYTLFFEGRAGKAIDDTVQIGVLAEDCTTFVANVSFALTSGSWNGYVILPQQIAGETCAVAYTGTYGEGDWREARTPLTVVDPEAEPFSQLVIGNPNGLTFSAGAEVSLYGVVVPGGGEVQVQLVADDGETVLVADTAVANTFGYWETLGQLPADYSGPATLVASTGEDDASAEVRQAVTITP